jgi:hypothetical protein
MLEIDNNLKCEFEHIDYTKRYNCTYVLKWSRGSSVSIVSDYGLDDRGSISDRDTGFFL